MDFIQQWAPRCELPVTRFLAWLGLGRSKWVSWKARYGRVNEHNAWIPRDFWIDDWEKAAIVVFYQDHPLEGYRRLAYMMLDADVVAVSASSVYRVLKQAGLLKSWAAPPSKKGRGFDPPETPHQHWHVDIAYLNVAGTFFFLCSVLDGFSRFIVHWEIRPQMTEADVEVVLQRAREAFPSARPRLISDNGPQFIARDFKAFIRLAGMTHVRVGDYVTYYNTVRLNSASGYLTPRDKLQAHAQQIFAQREAKLQAARERRRRHRGARLANPKGTSSASTSTAAQDLASQVLGFGIGLCHNLRVVRRNDTEAF